MDIRFGLELHRKDEMPCFVRQALRRTLYKKVLTRTKKKRKRYQAQFFNEHYYNLGYRPIDNSE
jgi:hypothetical protein